MTQSDKRICPWCKEEVYSTDFKVFAYPTSDPDQAAVTFHSHCAREITEEWYMGSVGLTVDPYNQPHKKTSAIG